ncbi:uncharacterized protein LOC128426428 [Pleuronectes platessa]|uniref:uncharacterized protein LOC128426428 n=1 Tax=Pleuronectes platessa TaxID=8262 RepID=UPI00232A1408|nr:uncharacterized protein LOC128426428 [Pleuronectes platessa]
MLARWPALFQMEEINAEFMRVTTVPLETKFLAQLDKHTSKLLEVIRSKGGRVKEQTKATLQVLDETVDITIRRECIFKSLMIYLGEPVHHLIKEVQDMQENEDTMAIVSGTEDIQIFIDGTVVLREVPTIVTAVAMFFGLTYALNIKYPKKLQYTLEFVQRVKGSLVGERCPQKCIGWLPSFAAKSRPKCCLLLVHLKIHVLNACLLFVFEISLSENVSWLLFVKPKMFRRTFKLGLC